MTPGSQSNASPTTITRLPVGPILALIGLLLIGLPAFYVSPQIPEPTWSNSVPQSSLGTIPQRQPLVIGSYVIALLVFYLICWRRQRGLMIPLVTLHLLSIPLLYLCSAVTAVGGGIGTAIITRLEHDQAEYVLVMRNIVGNGKLDLYRCLDGQCRGRMIAWDEWATYSNATLTVAGDPPQLVVDAIGRICFDLDRFNTAILEYATRPEAGGRRDQMGWQDGCNPSNAPPGD